MKPSIGRIVHFATLADSPSGEHYAAVITHVWNDTIVNLFVFPKGKSTDSLDSGVKTSVTYNEQVTESYTWHWPERVD